MKIDLETLIDVLDEEVDIFSINNSLDDATTDELRFIVNSFAKFFKGTYNGQESIFSVFKSFENTLEVIRSGAFGRTFTTNAHLLYNKIPTINDIFIFGTEDLIKDAKELERTNKELSIKIEQLEKEINDLKSMRTKSTSGSSGSSYGGGCMGSSTRRYGGC